MPMTLEDWVEQKIHLIFQELAEAVGNGEIEGVDDMAPDEVAGIPLALISADFALVKAWRNWLAEQ